SIYLSYRAESWRSSSSSPGHQTFIHTQQQEREQTHNGPGFSARLTSGETAATHTAAPNEAEARKTAAQPRLLLTTTRTGTTSSAAISLERRGGRAACRQINKDTTCRVGGGGSAV
ncbi:unnamed protein product, partial [Pylaiella littoralis]